MADAENMSMEEIAPTLPITKDTIITIKFSEDNSQEDISYHVTEIEEQAAEEASMEASTREEENEESEEEDDADDMNQIPIGVTEITAERNNKITTGEMLVFNEGDEPLQTIEDLEDSSDEEDISYAPDENEEHPTEDSDTESVDHNDLQESNIAELTVDMENPKLKFKDVIECREKLQKAEEEAESEEDPLEEDTQEYDEEADGDFNPVYCDQTLSDVEENEETPEEELEIVTLNDDICMIKQDGFVKIPCEEECSMEEESMEGTTQDSEKASMDCD